MTRPVTAAELVTDPARVADLDPTTAASILAQLTTVSAAVAARLQPQPARADTAPGADHLITASVAATITGMSTDWLYRSDAAKPFRVKMGGDVRFSFLGIQRFIERHRGK